MKNLGILSVMAFTAPLNSTEPPSQEYYAPISSNQTNEHLVFDDLNVYAKPISVSSETQKILKYFSRLHKIGNLDNNWDGHQASDIDAIIIENTINILKKIPDYLLADIDVEDIIPTPYGTIMIESEKDKNEISIEIGESELSFYTEINSTTYENNLSITKSQVNIDEIIQNLQSVFQ